ncbi:MAG TPA: ROK family transcriptional regulator [Gaiellaceae bacterium]
MLRSIRSRGPISRTDLARETGLSKPTVNEVVEKLLAAGYVRESLPDDGARPRRPGPRARLLSFRADLGHVLGVDIGANKILVLLADLTGEIVASERRRTQGDRDAAAVLRQVRAAASAALARAGVSRERLQSVVVGTPGVVDATGRVTLAPQLGGWEAIQLGQRLGRSFSCPVLVDNEVRLSVLAERWRGSAQGIDEAIYVQVGVGIGAGILIGGELYRGATGAAGEVGYLPFGADEPSGEGLGPFEHAAGGHAYARLGQAAARRSDGAALRELAGGDPDAVDAEAVFGAASRGDPAAAAIVEELVGRLARGIAAAVVVLNPATVIVGGGISRAGATLLEPLERALGSLVPVAPRLEVSSLGDEAVALGAVRLAVQEAEERMFAFEGA